MVAAVRSSPGSTARGVPNATSTRRCRRRLVRECFVPSGRGLVTEAIRWVPHSAIGTSGAPVSRASAAGPRISDRTAYACEIPASGKIPTASPSRSSRRAVRYAAAGASRSTGTCRIPTMARRAGESHTS